MKRKLFMILGIISLLVLGLGVGAWASSPPVMLEDNNGALSLCMNRAGGGTGYGNPVIAYNCFDSNDDFEWSFSPSSMCNAGKVSDNCPFDIGSGMNLVLLGDSIAVVYVYNENKCLGGSTSVDMNAKLEICPNPNGLNGGWSTIVVLVPAFGQFFVVINRHWSDALYEAHSGCNGYSCLIAEGAGAGYRGYIGLNIADSNVQSGYFVGASYFLQWQELYSLSR